MKNLLSERNIVVILFVAVLVTFVFAQEDSKKMEKMYSGITAKTMASLTADLKLPAVTQTSLEK